MGKHVIAQISHDLKDPSLLFSTPILDARSQRKSKFEYQWPYYTWKCPNALLMNGTFPPPIIDYYTDAEKFWQDTIGAIQALPLHRSRFDYIYPPYISNGQKHRNNGNKENGSDHFDYRLAFYASIAATSVLAFVLIVMCLLHHCGRKDLKAALCETNNIAARA